MKKEDDRNIVFVTVDSLRADHCGFVSSDSGLTPTIDRLAKNGVSFTQAIAPGPRTPSSLPVLFTGEFLNRSDDYTMSSWESRQRRIGRHMNRFNHLSEHLQNEGYETIAFTANPWTTRESNFDRGFKDFNEIRADSPDIASNEISDSILYSFIDNTVGAFPTDLFKWDSRKEWFTQWPGFFQQVRDRLQKVSKPFFLWVFILDTHHPYFTPRQYREESSAWEMYSSFLRYWKWKSSGGELPAHVEAGLGRAYRDAVRSVDAFMRDLTAETSRHNPVTVFVSDHGEALGEHGNFGHQQTLFEENLRVPLFIHNCGLKDTVHEQISLRRLPALLRELVESEELAPRSHASTFVRSKTEDNQHLAIRTPRWKFIKSKDKVTLFDIDQDPDETQTVEDEYPTVADSLAEIAERHERTQAEKRKIETISESFPIREATHRAPDSL